MQAEQYLSHHPSQYNNGTCFGWRNGFTYNQRHAPCRPPTGSHYRGRFTGNPGYPDCQPNREGPSQQAPYSSSYLHCSDAMPCLSPVSDIVENGERLLYPESVDNVSCQMNYIPGFINNGFLGTDQVTPSGLESGNGTEFKDISYHVPIANTWTSIRPKEWNTDQVLEWLYSILPREFEDVRLSEFNNVTGNELVSMTKYDMAKRFGSDAVADKVYEYLHKQYPQQEYNATQTLIPNNNDTNSTFWQTHQYSCFGLTELEKDPAINYPNYSQFSTNYDWYPGPRSDHESDGESGHSSLQPGNFINDKPYKIPPTQNPAHKKSPGRPRKEGKSRPKNGQRNHRLWEFILALLKDKDTCPRLVKWEDQEEGVFRFVQSDQVAKMWGERKQNPRMTYEKLSRAMRYYYKSNVLQPVIGRRLVYKFGPCATGWRPSEMNI